MDHKVKLIEYLYGEMDREELKTFEQLLSSNEQLRAELASLQAARKFAASDHDVVPTGLVQIMPTKNGASAPSPWRSKWMAIAASLLVLMVAGKLLDVRVVAEEGQFAIQYGEVSMTDGKDVRVIVQEELEREHKYLETKLASLTQQIEKQLGARVENGGNDKGLEDQLAAYSNQISALKTDLRNDQLARYNTLLEQLHQDQRDHSTELMQGMVRYVEAQRQQDLELINQGFENLSMAVQLGENYTQFVNQPLQKF